MRRDSRWKLDYCDAKQCGALASSLEWNFFFTLGPLSRAHSQWIIGLDNVNRKKSFLNLSIFMWCASKQRERPYRVYLMCALTFIGWIFKLSQCRQISHVTAAALLFLSSTESVFGSYQSLSGLFNFFRDIQLNFFFLVLLCWEFHSFHGFCLCALRFVSCVIFLVASYEVRGKTNTNESQQDMRGDRVAPLQSRDKQWHLIVFAISLCLRAQHFLFVVFARIEFELRCWPLAKLFLWHAMDTFSLPLVTHTVFFRPYVDCDDYDKIAKLFVFWCCED